MDDGCPAFIERMASEGTGPGTDGKYKWICCAEGVMGVSA